MAECLIMGSGTPKSKMIHSPFGTGEIESAGSFTVYSDANPDSVPKINSLVNYGQYSNCSYLDDHMEIQDGNKIVIRKQFTGKIYTYEDDSNTEGRVIYHDKDGADHDLGNLSLIRFTNPNMFPTSGIRRFYPGEYLYFQTDAGVLGTCYKTMIISKEE